MTISDILAHVRERRGEWVLDSLRIRRPLTERPHGPLACPVSSVNDRSAGRFVEAAKAVGLTYKDARRIAMAADVWDSPDTGETYDGGLRRRLLEAAGLEGGEA